MAAQFTRMENWNPWRRPGAWPDADMLPLGRLALGKRDTKFTPDEQRTLMTLWSIARSPLIMGGDLRHLGQYVGPGVQLGGQCDAKQRLGVGSGDRCEFGHDYSSAFS